MIKLKWIITFIIGAILINIIGAFIETDSIRYLFCFLSGNLLGTLCTSLYIIESREQ